MVDKYCVLCMHDEFDCVWFSPRFSYIRTRTGLEEPVLQWSGPRFSNTDEPDHKSSSRFMNFGKEPDQTGPWQHYVEERE
jgi:hypothetical protein